MPRVIVNQSAAGTTTLVAAVAGQVVVLTRAVLTLSATGTLKFNDTVNDLTGPFDIAAQGGFVMPGDRDVGWAQSGAGNQLNLVTTIGAARGVIDYYTAFR